MASRVFLLLSLFVSLARADCPQHGCTPFCSYSSDVSLLTDTTPKLLWSWKSVPGGPMPSGAGCVTNDASIACPLIGDNRSYLMYWDAEDGGKTTWNTSFPGSVVLPLMDIEGDVIASDGYVLVGYHKDGTPLGQEVPLFPINGELFDLTLVNQEVTLLYKCGFLVTYFTNGVPHASIWLNDTIDGEHGTYIPLAAPASRGQRLYILGVFRPHSSSAQNTLRLRLYAIELSVSTVYRIIIAWHYDFNIPGVSLSYLNSSETVCTLHPPEIDKDKRSVQPLAHITVDGNQDNIAVLFNYREPAGESHGMNNSRMMVFKDTGKSGVLIVSEDSPHFAQALAYSIGSDSVDKYWTALFDAQTEQSFLQEHKYSTGEKTATIDISKLLGFYDKKVNVTSEMLFLQSNSAFSLVFCVLVDSTQSMLVSVYVPLKQALWTVNIGSEQCLGQITSVDGTKESYLILTTSSQMCVYGPLAQRVLENAS